jgi:hypothetical protein
MRALGMFGSDMVKALEPKPFGVVRTTGFSLRRSDMFISLEPKPFGVVRKSGQQKRMFQLTVVSARPNHEVDAGHRGL